LRQRLVREPPVLLLTLSLGLDDEFVDGSARRWIGWRTAMNPFAIEGNGLIRSEVFDTDTPTVVEEFGARLATGPGIAKDDGQAIFSIIVDGRGFPAPGVDLFFHAHDFELTGLTGQFFAKGHAAGVALVERRFHFPFHRLKVRRVS
jgi:hypothetical protein